MGLEATLGEPLGLKMGESQGGQSGGHGGSKPDTARAQSRTRPTGMDQKDQKGRCRAGGVSEWRATNKAAQMAVEHGEERGVRLTRGCSLKGRGEGL